MMSFGLLSCKNKQSRLTLQSEFTELLGKNTKQWFLVKSDKDEMILNALKKVYDQNCAAQHEEPGIYKIPKVVHCIWLGPKPFPQASVENMRTWVAKHPDWQFKFWTDRIRLPPCRGFEVCLIQDSDFARLKKYYDQATNWGEKADYFRYEILYRDGGVYVDHDANALVPFDSLNCAYDFYGCTEAPHRPILDMAVTVGIGLIGTKPKHPILMGCMDAVEVNWQREQASGVDHPPMQVLERSYIALTHSVLKYLNQGKNKDIVFPASYFFASKYLPSFYSHHFYATAWAKKSQPAMQEQMLIDLYKQKKKEDKTMVLCKLLLSSQVVMGVIIALFLVRKYAKS